MSVSKPAICFSKRVVSIKWRNKLLIHNINLIGHRKSAYCLRLLVFMKIWIIAALWHLRSQVFHKGCCHHDLKTFCKTGCNSVLSNNIENMKLRWLVYHLSLLFTHLVKWPWRTEGEIKNRKSSLNFTFGLRSCLISDFARANSNKAVLVQVFLRFEIVIFNNHFAFFMMNSFCSMARVVVWTLAGEIIKRANVCYPVCLNKYWKKLDKHLWRGPCIKSCAITNHSYLKRIRHLAGNLRCWLKYEKIN